MVWFGEFIITVSSEIKNLHDFMAGKTIRGLIAAEQVTIRELGIGDDNAFDLVFDDGSWVEFYVIGERLVWSLNPAPEPLEGR